MKKSLLLSILIVVLAMATSGCAKLAHLQELLCLKAYSTEKDSQAVLVEKQNDRFVKLLAAVKSGAIVESSDQKAIWMKYGPPIFEKTVEIETAKYQVWMYRYTTKLFGSDKVYLYFDAKGKLRIFDYSPGGAMTPVIEVADEKK